LKAVAALPRPPLWPQHEGEPTEHPPLRN
jgi:hypothetical protein